MPPNKRAPSIMGDEARALIGGAKTPALGVPVAIEHDEIDKTPPPREPGDITQIPGFDSIDPATREALLALHNVDREQDVGIMRLWGARKVHEELASLRNDVNVVIDRTNSLTTLPAAVASLGGSTARLAALVEERAKQEGRLEDMLKGIGDRVRDVEVKAQGQAAEIIALGARVTTADGEAMKDVGELKGKLEKVKTEHSDRITSLESSRTKLRGALAMLGIVATVLASVGAWVLGKLVGVSGAK